MDSPEKKKKKAGVGGKERARERRTMSQPSEHEKQGKNHS
jgi:hypothetical protein